MKKISIAVTLISILVTVVFSLKGSDAESEQYSYGDNSQNIINNGRDVTVNIDVSGNGDANRAFTSRNVLILEKPDITQIKDEDGTMLPKGIKIEKFDTRKQGYITFFNIKVLSGEHKGRIGWVTQDAIEYR
jgi:hypothetical protein